MLDVRQQEYVGRPTTRTQSSPRAKGMILSRDSLKHPVHDGCCVTAPFLKVMVSSSAPVLVVDGDGFIVYANAETEDLMGYPELAGKHITEIVAAAANWVASEFSYLADNRLWNGNVLLRRFQGDNLRVNVNAFKSLIPGDTAEYIAFLHGIERDGPAILRNPNAVLQEVLSTDDVALLELLSEGFDDKEAAAILGLPVATVDREVHRLLQKLNVASRSEACIKALREGLLAA